MRLVSLVLCLLSICPANAQKYTGVADCSFQADPEKFLQQADRARRDLQARVQQLGRMRPASAADTRIGASEIARRNFIDDEIFGKLINLNMPSARMSTGEEFFRRIHLDLTGAIPSPADIRAFLADDAPNKRDTLIDRLLRSDAFTDRWTMWFGDLLQNTSTAANFDRQIDGRNAYHAWIRAAVESGKSIREIASEAVTGTGNSYTKEVGGANFPMNAITPMGPPQDQFDTMLNKMASTFLGLSHYDCLLCHNGRGHLDQVSLWGATSTRTEAQYMAAFFARMKIDKPARPATDFFFLSYEVSDTAAGSYDLNINYGNRPDRLPIGGARSLTPAYRVTGAAPSSNRWRAAFADNMVQDPMFAINFANRIWQQMFTLALVDPVDGLDPARLDPANPPEAPWTMQSTHPELLVKLARELADSDYNLRAFLRVLVQSSAYQLSSQYAGDWKLDYVPLFARHYPRRLEGEEIHDALGKISGVKVSYNVRGWPEPVTLAIRLPEPLEPRTNGQVANFMNVFLRGNRDTDFRSQNGSILQQLALMNDRFVRDRVTSRSSPGLQAITRLSDNDAVIDELFLLFLSRGPSEYEKDAAQKFLTEAKTPALRTEYIEDLAWSLINKVEFLFSF